MNQVSVAETMLTTADIAVRLNVSNDTALRIMKSTPGVLRLGAGSRTLYRMPHAAFNALVARKSSLVKKGDGNE
jgi:hypothetical protein